MEEFVLEKLVLIGGGGHCKSVLDAALSMNQFEEIVITDATMPESSTVLGCRVVGNDSILPKLRKQGFEYACVTVGSIKSSDIRVKLAKMVAGLGFLCPVIIDSSACVSRYAVVEEGSFIGKHVVINADVHIGKHCIINTGSIIEHECSIGDHTHISVGSIICGDSHVGNESFIGAGSTVIQGIRIGEKVIIGANSTVLTNIENNMKCYGIINNRGV